MLLNSGYLGNKSLLFQPNKSTLLLIFYITLSLAITMIMNSLITFTPIEGDAEQNFRMAYNKYKYGILSSDREGAAERLKHGNYREPLPPIVMSLFMHAHPGINKNQDFQSFVVGNHIKKIKQVNLVWIILLFAGLLGLCYSIINNHYIVFLTYSLTVFYFIRFGNHFDQLTTELPAAVLMIFATWFLILSIKETKYSYYLLAGIFIGLLILVKAVFLYIAPFVFAFLLIERHLIRKKRINNISFKQIAMFLVGIAIVIMPWMTRNKVFIGEFEVTQRGGIVLHYRAIHNQMNMNEIMGAFHFFGPEIYQSISNIIFDIEDQDFEADGKFRRLNRSHVSDREAISYGRTNQAISFYAYTRAERSRLVDNQSDIGLDAPLYNVDNLLGLEAREMIVENPLKHILMTPVFLWRGTWCFPNSTIPFFSSTLQVYVNNVINFLAFLSFCIIFVFAFRKKDPRLLALILLPCVMILLQSFVSHNIPRYSEPAIPISLISLAIVFQFIFEFLKEKINLSSDTSL